MKDESARLLACIPRLRRYARALVGGRARADDLVQATMERGWRKLSSRRQDGDMRAWLFGIMHNLHSDQLRRPQLPPVTFDEDMPMPEPEPPQAGLPARDMASALAMLPPEQRAVLLLVALEEMTYEETATTLGIPLGTVISRLSRGRERLRMLVLGQAVAPPLRVVK